MMSSKQNKNVSMPDMPVEPLSLKFSIYTSEEVKKLSVAEIRTSLLFDTLGLPLKSGLHDPRLGPTEDRGEPCKTCRATYMTCPGHMGHIELPLPVINPMFYKVVYLLAKITCSACSTVQLNATQKYLFITQMKLLDAGYANEAQEAESLLSEESSGGATMAQTQQIKDTLDEYYNQVVALDKTSEEDSSRLIECKMIQSIRNAILYSLPKKAEHKKTCIICKERLKKYTSAFHKLYMVKPIQGGEIKGGTKVVVNVQESRDILRKLWVNESEFVLAFAPLLKKVKSKYPTDLFFLMVIPVLPIRLRPTNILNGKMSMHPQTIGYKPIIDDCIILRHLITEMKFDGDALTQEGKILSQTVKGDTITEKLFFIWQSLQANVDRLMDVDMNPIAKGMSRSIGLKQVIEKKAGCIRMNMMGKRVNYAARSVITPDPNLEVEEIGVPEAFALVLTYPTPVTSYNVSELRKMIVNGPLIHPGAVTVETEDGKLLNISSNDAVQRESLAKRLLTPCEEPNGGLKGLKVVHRHLKNGDVLLLNRQPTLHRPSIMAHKARILKGERTFRLNYANCKAYNADFDGDEMNAHFPQNELARSEAYNLVNVCNNYLVPKDGTPLSGLIQDHVIAGVKLTMRGRFFNKEDYYQLTYQALNTNTNCLRLVRPAILKPEPLWSGKQIITTVLINIIPLKQHRLHLKSTSKISSKAWQNEEPREWKAGGTKFLNPETMTEAEVIIRGGELLCGVLDKTHYGATPYGLVHCLYELYGGRCSSHLLSAFSKLFTAFLQSEGFTLGVEDILVVDEAENHRREFIVESRNIGNEALANALDLIDPDPQQLEEKLEDCLSTNKIKYRTLIDRSYKTVLDGYTNKINKMCLPAGLLKKFPENNLQLMVQSGAKGSTVNTMQISCLLGQIELEGKRPPLMISGKSLPSFPRYDTTPRAGGFIDGRFLTGIQPPEFFFHCMAGREGLIDTAVKTSRSGYLQRCLVKHLEGLVVNYDQTVRDSDGSVIQFYYGEDGLDVTKAQFLTPKQMPFVIDNISTMNTKEAIIMKQDKSYSKIRKKQNKISRWREKFGTCNRVRSSPFSLFSQDIEGNLPEGVHSDTEMKDGRSQAAMATNAAWWKGDPTIRQKYGKKNLRCPDPVTSEFQSDQCFGAVTERIEKLMNDYLTSRTPPESSRLQQSQVESEELMFLKSMRSQCHPGEPVGLLAAQSIGEPSTQMTLNTFHFAGRGEMNVTLGIPRLREILMVASKTMKTPSMDIPLRQDVSNVEAKAEHLRKKLSRVTLSDVLQSVNVNSHLQVTPERKQVFMLKFQFLPHEIYKSKYAVNPKYIINFMEKEFVSLLLIAIKKRAKASNVLIRTETEGLKVGENGDGGDEDDPEPMKISLNIGEAHVSSDEEEDAEDEDATGSRIRVRQEEGQEYDDAEDLDELNEDPMEESEELETFNPDHDTDEGMKEDTISPSRNVNLQLSNEKVDIRRNNMLHQSPLISDYRYDKKEHLWCHLELKVSMDLKKIDYSTLLKEVAEKCVIWQVPFLKRAFIYSNLENKQLMFKTDGINIAEMFKHYKLLDLNKLYTNDIHGIASTYGIEASRRVIVKEVQDVFNMYGITVDARHLLLVADYMTFNGTIEPLNRIGMEKSVSPLQQMTFESSLQFVKTATLRGKKDHLESPSSRLILGRPAKSGTGIFQIIQTLDSTLTSPLIPRVKAKIKKGKRRSKKDSAIGNKPVVNPI